MDRRRNKHTIILTHTRCSAFKRQNGGIHERKRNKLDPDRIMQLNNVANVPFHPSRILPISILQIFNEIIKNRQRPNTHRIKKTNISWRHTSFIRRSQFPSRTLRLPSLISLHCELSSSLFALRACACVFCFYAIFIMHHSLYVNKRSKPNACVFSVQQNNLVLFLRLRFAFVV